MPTNFPTQTQMNALERGVHRIVLALPHIGLILLLAVIGALLLSAALTLTFRLLNFRRLVREEMVLLELTPPAYVDRTPLAAAGFFTELHGFDQTRAILKKLLRSRAVWALEIVSSRQQGIRFIVRMPKSKRVSFEKDIAGHVSGTRIRVADDYLSDAIDEKRAKVLVFRQTGHFGYPLQHDESHGERDLVAYLASAMTNLHKGETMAFQIVLTPAQIRNASRIKNKLMYNQLHVNSLGKQRAPRMQPVFDGINSMLSVLTDTAGEIASGRSSEQVVKSHKQQAAAGIKPARSMSVLEASLAESVNDNLERPHYLANIRALVISESQTSRDEKADDIRRALGVYRTSKQSLVSRFDFPYLIKGAYRFFLYRHRLPGLLRSQACKLSTAELAAIYHFPHSVTGRVDNVRRSYSKTLPAPVEQKRHADRGEFDVILGMNNHPGIATPIGLTAGDREQHVFIVGGTGNGKTTMMEYAIVQDMRAGHGLAFIDPHGTSAKKLLRYVPKNRIQDVIYFNPKDFNHPIGMNPLELPPSLSGRELAHEKELITEAVLSVLKRVFDTDMDTSAHRIERVLRKAILTAFTVPDATLFTVLKILAQASYRKKVLHGVKDERLRRFWYEEIAVAGEMQRVKLTDAAINRIDRFEDSEAARLIIGQPKSTINFDDIINGRKILICDLSKGALGEDTAKLFGTVILALLQLAALRRESIPEDRRAPFYLFADEFQNFASDSFMGFFSEARKYKLFVTMAQQSVAQLKDQNMLNVILDNVGTVIAFRSKSEITEKMLLHQFGPAIEMGEISNLPRYNFYAKVAATEPQETTSGETIVLSKDEGSDGIAKKAIATSRKQFGGEPVDDPKVPNNKQTGNTPDADEKDDFPDSDRPVS